MGTAAVRSISICLVGFAVLLGRKGFRSQYGSSGPLIVPAPSEAVGSALGCRVGFVVHFSSGCVAKINIPIPMP